MTVRTEDGGAGTLYLAGSDSVKARPSKRSWKVETYKTLKWPAVRSQSNHCFMAGLSPGTG